MSKEKKVTARAVAKLAGVSPATVSMILNQTTTANFSEKTRNRVFEACDALGYKRILPMQHSGLMGNMLVAICPSYQNLHYVRLLSSIQHRARELGFSVLTYSTSRNEDEERRILNMCSENIFAGVLFLYQPEDANALRILGKKKPVVHVYDKSADLNIDTMELDSRKIGRLVGEYFLELGHQKIAYITTNLVNKQLARIHRLDGIKEAFTSVNLAPETHIRISTPETEGIESKKVLSEYEIGFQIAKKLVESNADITAMATMNDMVALGVMDGILACGKKIPNDYSVCGCDNISVSGYQRISLTTVEHYAAAKGREAVSILARKICGNSILGEDIEGANGVIRVEYEPKLIIRNSTRRNKQ